jgi:hypothetical protein
MATFSKLLGAAAFAALLIATPCTTGITACAQESPHSSTFSAVDYAGTWRWVFDGKPFVTMIHPAECRRIHGVH